MCNLLLTGASGFLGTHVRSLFELDDRYEVFAPSSDEMDCIDLEDVSEYLFHYGITHIVHMAAKVGGIGANKREPADFFYDNLMMSTNILKAASTSSEVEKVMCIGTICSMPHTPPHIPFKEEDLFEGFPEATNAPYGIARRCAILYGNALTVQCGLKVLNPLLVNLAGYGDKFNPLHSHVIPAIILKMDKAKDLGLDTLNLWGTGKATREFLSVRDASHAIKIMLENYETPDPINIGTGKEITIADLAEKIKKHLDFQGNICFTGQVSDGQPRRCLDVTKAKKVLGFEARISLDEMLMDEVNYYHELKRKQPEVVDMYRTLVE